MKSALLFLVTLLSGLGRSVSSKDDSQKLMLILLDGFRWDYVEKYDLPHFKRFYSTGVRAENIENVFPSLSFPNYYSITTGLYPENHGIVGNVMFDRETGQQFVLDHNPDHLRPHWWEGAVPIWVSLEKQGKSAYIFRWRGPEVSIFGTHPKWYIPYKGIPTIGEFRTATKDGLAVLTNGSADFVGIYHEEVDHYGHTDGPDSSIMKAVLVGIDKVIGNLLDTMEELDSNKKVNLMVVSDHGMTEIDRSRTINITSVLTPDLYTTITEDNAICNIFLSDPSLQDRVYNLLANFNPHLKVYKREDIPDRFHYKHGKHVPEIVCVADLGWAIQHPLKPDFFKNAETGDDMKGTHGYDNSKMDMKGIFYGKGPHFKTGSSVKSIRVVDLYNVMCDIIGITPLPNNGTVQNVAPLLASSGVSSTYRQIISGQKCVLLIFINMALIFSQKYCWR